MGPRGVEEHLRRMMELGGLSCYGFLLELGSRTLGYTGDTVPCNGLDELASSCDTLIAECNGPHADPKAHLDVDDVVALRRRFPALSLNGASALRNEGYSHGMGFTMAPAFFSSDLDRTSKFWGALGFAVVRRDAGYMILEHPMGIVINFGLDPDLTPSENMTNAYLRFTTSDEAVALYEEWVDRVSDDGFIHAPGTTFYGMTEWGMTDPDANALRVGGPAEANSATTG